MTRTYHVGASGQVHRLDNLTGSWIDVSLSSTFASYDKITLLDVETDPNDSNRVIAVGNGAISHSTYGIYISIDGGVTWTQPGGNYQTNVDAANELQWFEVTIVNSSVIYVSGQNGYVARSVDGGGNFNLVTQLPALPTCGTCPAIIPHCLSVHFISPTIGVVGTEAHVAYTNNGGTTWNILNGGNVITGAPNGDAFRIGGVHISADQQTIVALSAKNIFVSTDAGTTWTNVFQFGLRDGYHLTWTSDLNLWGFGGNGQRVRSIDGGLTWIVLSPFLQGGSNHFAGHFYQGDNGFYSADNNMLATGDGALTGTITDPTTKVIHAVWTHVDPIECYILRDCTGAQQDVIVSDDMSQYVGQVISWCSNVPLNFPLPDPALCSVVPGCWQVLSQDLSTCTCYQLYSITDACTFQYTDCRTNEVRTILVSSAEGQTIPTICAVIGSVSVISGSGNAINSGLCPQCSCEDALPQGSVTVLATFVDCTACLPPCYLLQDCEGVLPDIVTDTDLAAYVGQIIRLQTCPDDCWQVSIAPDCTGAIGIGNIIATFPDCVSCNPLVPTPPLELHPRRIKPGYNTLGCPPEYVEKVSCTFGEQVYDEMVKNRYGITICCDHDVDKWDIKKQILDLKAIYDPALCRCFLPECCPPTCVEATLQVFTPVACPAPSAVDAVLIIT